MTFRRDFVYPLFASFRHLPLDNAPQKKRIPRVSSKEVRRIPMKTVRSIVGFVGGECKGEAREQAAWTDSPVSSDAVNAWLKRGYRKRKAERKYLGTVFGAVCFWRTYVRKPGGLGLHPLDQTLGLTADGFSFSLMEICA